MLQDNNIITKINNLIKIKATDQESALAPRNIALTLKSKTERYIIPYKNIMITITKSK